MTLVFSGQRNAPAVLGPWTPPTKLGRLGYRLWAVLGAVVVGLLYPFAVVGFAVRHYGRQLYRVANALGIRNLLLLSIAVWGVLTAIVYVRAYPLAGIIAVAAGGSVAAVSSVLALVFTRWDGRPTTALMAAPFGVTAIFLPPVVAALYSSTLAGWIFPTSNLLAVWLLDGPLAIVGVAATLRAQFELVGLAYVGMWFGIAVPIGWMLGLLVAFADFVRAADPATRR